MPSYEWACLACGHPNPPGTAVCAACTCHALASRPYIAAIRERYRSNGGAILAGAGKLPEEGDNDIVLVFGKLVLKLLGSIL